MKIGILAKPNAKGQLVIPKEIRKALGITPQTPLHIVMRGSGFYIYPVRGIISETDTANTYVKILEKTRGTWTAEGPGQTVAKKTALELAASARRRPAW